MAQDTTLSAQRRTGVPSPPHESWDNGDCMGELQVEVDDQRFRVRTARFST